MADLLQNILAQLSRTDSVVVRGGEAPAEKRVDPVLLVLSIIAVLLAFVALAVTLGRLAAGERPSAALTLVAIAFGLVIVVYRLSTKNNATRAATPPGPIVIDPRGITIRGVGPIPWRDVGPPRIYQVPGAAGLVPRAVLPLTPSGIQGVNSLPPATRLSLGPLGSNGFMEFVYVPGVQGLSEPEAMHLFGTAHRMFVGAPPRR